LAAVCLMAKLAVADEAPAKAKGDEKAAAAAPAPSAAPEAKAGEVKAPEFVKLDKTAKMQPVNFPHAAHGKLFPCKDCHEGKVPLFAQKRGEAGMKMADMRAGKGCGSCHDGKRTFDKDKKIFAATMCMKCHKKAEAKPEVKAEVKP
jgi:c(7)-type cytochrome triheme protein